MINKIFYILLISQLWACNKSQSGEDDQSTESNPEFMGGKSGTIFDASSNAFKAPINDLSEDDMAKHLVGDGFFESRFVTSPAVVNPGLGPLFNNTGCDGCHQKEGRGKPMVGRGPQGSQMLVFVSMPTGEPEVPGGPVPVPGIGFQILDQAVFGQTPNAVVSLTWEEQPEQTFEDGTPYTLRKPKLNLTLADGSAFPSGMLQSVRQPLPVFGLGLLEAIPEADIIANESATGKVPGRLNWVWSVTENSKVLGRFGRKASIPSVVEQAGKAFALDIGLVNEVFKEIAQGATGPNDEPIEISKEAIDGAAFYLQTLAVPARRNMKDTEVLRGETLFTELGCVGCHQPQWKTGDHAVKGLANQVIFPYSDFLLHDMGEGLADNRPDFEANGKEWRTPTLWGIGLTETILPQASYLHDGRARSLPEAILWHSGQAEGMKEGFRRLPVSDRDALIKFLRSL